MNLMKTRTGEPFPWRVFCVLKSGLQAYKYRNPASIQPASTVILQLYSTQQQGFYVIVRRAKPDTRQSAKEERGLRYVE